MRALTLKQPWASAIMHLGKDVENRSWPIPQQLIGQRIAIHAGRSFDARAGELLSMERASIPSGMLLGTVELRGYVKLTHLPSCVGLSKREVEVVCSSRWAETDSEYWWYVVEPQPFQQPILHKGMLGFWTVPEHVASALLDQK